MKLDLQRMPAAVYTARRFWDRHARVTDMLGRLGFENWRFVFGDDGSHWSHGYAGHEPYWSIMKRDMAREMAAMELPFLWIEDDAADTRHFRRVVDLPDGCDWAFLGGCCIGSNAGKVVARRERPDLREMTGPDVRHVLNRRGFAHTQYAPFDGDWVRVWNMYSSHAMLVATRRARDAILGACAEPFVNDYTFSLIEGRLLTLCRKREMFYQLDKNELYTRDYFREAPLVVRLADWVACTVGPAVTLWELELREAAGAGVGMGPLGLGMGEEAAADILRGQDGVYAAREAGRDWLEPATITETGLCVWEAGETPSLAVKVNPAFLGGRLAVVRTAAAGVPATRDKVAAAMRGAVAAGDVGGIAAAMRAEYAGQVKAGCPRLDERVGVARRWDGSGKHALFLFEGRAERDAFVSARGGDALAVEPWMRRPE